MPAVRRKVQMEVGQVWEGCSKKGYGLTRRRIVAITDDTVSWEIVGSCFNGPKSATTSRAAWQAWTKLQVIR